MSFILHCYGPVKSSYNIFINNRLGYLVFCHNRCRAGGCQPSGRSQMQGHLPSNLTSMWGKKELKYTEINNGWGGSREGHAGSSLQGARVPVSTMVGSLYREREHGHRRGGALVRRRRNSALENPLVVCCALSPGAKQRRMESPRPREPGKSNKEPPTKNL